MARLKIIIPPRWVTHGEGDHVVRPSSTWRAFLGGAAYVNPVHTALQHIQHVLFEPKELPPVELRVGASYLAIHFRKREPLVLSTRQIEKIMLDQYRVNSFVAGFFLSRRYHTRWQIFIKGEEQYTFYTHDSKPYQSLAVAALERNWLDSHAVRLVYSGQKTNLKADRGYVSCARYSVNPRTMDEAKVLPQHSGTDTRSDPTIYIPQPQNQLGPEVEISRERIHLILAELPAPFQPPRRPTALRDGAYQETPFRAGAIELTPRHIIVRLDDQPVRLYAYTELADLRIGLADIFRDCHLPAYEYESYRYADIAFSIPGQSFRYFIDNTHYKITALSLGVKFLTGFNEVDAPEYKQEDVVHEPRYENRRYEARRIWLPRP